jgi:hypothetical protein
MGRRLYWQDSYGRIHRDREAERGRSARVGWTGKALLVLAVIAALIVIASLIH